MPSLTFILPSGQEKTVEIPENWSIMQAGVEFSVPEIKGICGGCISCATCHVYIDEEGQKRLAQTDNEQSPEEADLLETIAEATEYSRLGCQIKITKALDGLVVKVPRGW